jgi:hypothetical protein
MSCRVITIANGSGGDWCAAVPSEVSAACVDLLAVHPHRFRRLDPKADPVALDRDHDDPNGSVDDDLFSRTPREYKHGRPSLAKGEKQGAQAGWDWPLDVPFV